MAVQQAGVFWMYEDPITKSKRVCDANGNTVSGIETDPYGADTSRSFSQAFQPKRFTSYDRDGNGSDEAMYRRYNRWHSRFDQPDPADESYDFGDPQSFNRYAYSGNDPVNFNDPSGLYTACIHEVMTRFLARLTGHSRGESNALAGFAGAGGGGADSEAFAATSWPNWAQAIVGEGPSIIHFMDEQTLQANKRAFPGYLRAGRS